VNGGAWQPASSFVVTPTTTTANTVHVRNTAGCTATFAPTTVTVQPTPAPTINAPATACAGSTVTVTAGGGGSYCFTQTTVGATHNPYLTGNDTPVDVDCLDADVACSFTASNSYNVTIPEAGSVTVCVTVKNDAGCTASICTTITGVPVSSASISLASPNATTSQTVCTGQPIADIVYATSGIMAVSDADITGLPPGINTSLVSG
jgi:hypothetical protein